MNKAVKITAIAAAVALLGACGNAEKAQVKVETDADKQSYALGASMGRYLNNNLEKNGEIGIELKKDLILGGIEDALSDKVQLSDEEIETVMNALEADVRKRGMERQKELTEAAKAEGTAFLAENAKRKEVTVTPSGLQYEILKKGNGPKPQANNTVKVHYHGTLIDGTVFDSSVERGEPAEFGVTQVIKGWQEALQLMPVGSKWELYIPHFLAYGAQSKGSIPAYSALIFELELLEIVK